MLSRFAACIGMAIGIGALPASAQHFCSQPTPPRCATLAITFEDQYIFDECGRQMDRYRRNVSDFSECLLEYLADVGRQLSDEKDQAVVTYQEHVRFFNCRAAGPDNYCAPP